MLTGPEERLLTTLASIEVDRNLRRDFPPSLSLPALAMELGVVRSALHVPAAALESKGLIQSIKSNVIGATRRRTVLLLTKKGVELANDLSVLHGNDQNAISIFGRSSDIEALQNILSEPGIVTLTGLPGIGKTTLARAVAHGLEKEGRRLGWCTANAATDLDLIMKSWTKFAFNEPYDLSASRLEEDSLYVLDEAQEIHHRHAESIKSMIQNAHQATILVITRTPSIFSTIPSATRYTLEGVDIEVASKIAPHLEEKRAKQIATALGGHPLAIEMWREGDDLPTPETPIAEFVTSTVLSRLSTSSIQGLDELSLEPFPVQKNHSLSDQTIADLDEAAILKWGELGFEAHHLIRNVHSAAMDEMTRYSIHANLASHWSDIPGHEARAFEMHHRISSGQTLDLELANVVSEESESAIAASLLSDALEREDRDDLRILAAHVAISRGETTIARKIAIDIEEGPDRWKIELECARMSGDDGECSRIEELLLDRLPDSERASILVRGAIAMHDDRLPGPLDPELATRLTKRLDLTERISSEMSPSLIASRLILRYIIASGSSDVIQAASLRSSIVEILGEDHPRLKEVDLKITLRPWNGVAESRLFESIQRTPGRYDRLKKIHWGLDSSSPDIPLWLINAHDAEFKIQDNENRPEHRRIDAFAWYWSGAIHSDDRIRLWAEAARRLRAAGCMKAASEVLDEIHVEIRSRRR